MKARAMEILGVAFAVLLTLALVELGYRVYLWQSVSQAAAAPPPANERPSFSFYGENAPWRLDAAYGFKFNEGDWLQGRIRDGAFDSCEVTGLGNRYGNAGLALGDYESAEVKVALFGSSYTLVHITGEDTTAIRLQKALAQRLGKTVHVLNFSRDATGFLTMFDIARSVVRDYKPDLMLFAFNTPALVYGRHWRVVKESAPGMRRMYFTQDPGGATPSDRALPHANPMSPRVDAAWCAAMAAAAARGDTQRLSGDPVVRALIDEFNAIRRDQRPPIHAERILTARHSLVYAWLAKGGALRGLTLTDPNAIWTPIALDDYASDAGFAAAVAEVKASGIPFHLIHIPALAELRTGIAFPEGAGGVSTAQRTALLASLERMTGKKIVELMDYYEPSVLKDPLALVASEEDSHPSLAGASAMARALDAYLATTSFRAR